MPCHSVSRKFAFRRSESKVIKIRSVTAYSNKLEREREERRQDITKKKTRDTTLNAVAVLIFFLIMMK